MSKNPTGVRTVTVIVTHDNPARDFSRTYTNRQITEGGAGYTDEVHGWQMEPDTREWHLTTFENQPASLADSTWSLPRPKGER